MLRAASRLASRSLGPLLALGCAQGSPGGDSVSFTVPAGSSFDQVIDTLSAHGLVAFPLGFEVAARLRGDDREIRFGDYMVPADIGWLPLLDHLVAGRVITVPLTIPEGFTLRQIAPRRIGTHGYPRVGGRTAPRGPRGRGRVGCSRPHPRRLPLPRHLPLRNGGHARERHPDDGGALPALLDGGATGPGRGARGSPSGR